MGLTKEQILAKAPKSAADLPREKVIVPGLGEWWLRALSGTERDEFEFETSTIRETGGEPLIGIRGRVIAWSTCDEQGNRILNSEDGKVVGMMDAGTLDTLFDVAGRLSGFTKQAIAELEKNSPGTTSDSSASS